MRDTTPGQKSAVNRIGFALLVATPKGEIRYMPADARRMFRSFFPRPLRRGALPHKVEKWLARDRADRAGRLLMAKRQGARLFVTKQHPHPPGEMSLLLELVNERAAGSTRRHGKLTLRENEVLRWIADGKSNQQIAEILGISVGTVRKHIERIFDKLGVDNRAAAASSYHSVPTEHR